MIAGGNGGQGFYAGAGSVGGAGGAGLTGSNLAITNSGTISGGLGGAGSPSAADGAAGFAIDFTGGANRLTLATGSAITGAINVGAETTSLDLAQPTNATLANAIVGAGAVSKSGAGTLTLSGTNTFAGGLTLNDGTLAVAADASLGASGTFIRINGGTLETTADGFASNRNFFIGSGSSAASTVNINVQVDAGTSTLSGQISDSASGGGNQSGALTKTGAGTLNLAGAGTYFGGTTIAAGTLDLGFATSAGSAPIAFDAMSGTATATLALETGAQNIGGTFGNVLAGFNAASESLDLKGFAFNGTAAYTNLTGSITITGGTGGTQRQTFALTDGALAYTAQDDGAGGTLITAVCFTTGTAIRVRRQVGDRGCVDVDVAVEDLAVGDLAVTASGALRPIAWLGSQEMDCSGHPDPRRVRPIRIAAHAFGPERPARDLRVSPDHALCVDLLGEVLVPAHAFLNGATVTQDRDDAVTYWHVELEGGHDILLAENLPAESYLDCGNRGFFAGEVAPLDPGLDAAGSCRERTTDPVLLAALRARLRGRALALGWRLDAADGDGPDLGGLRLLVDGVPVLPDTDGLAARFLLPAEARDVWLVSAASVPWDVSDTTDGRRLGLCLRALSLTDGLAPERTIALDDPRLAAGFHPAEPGCRWTDGRARLDPSLWAGCRGHVFLRLELARPCLPAWRAPAGRGADLRAA